MPGHDMGMAPASSGGSLLLPSSVEVNSPDGVGHDVTSLGVSFSSSAPPNKTMP